MSSPTFGIPPSLLDNTNSRGETWPSLDPAVAEGSYLPTQSLSATSFASHHHLSPYSHIPSNSASPTLNESTPADSLSVYSEQYQPSELSDHPDPFFGVDFDDFNDDEGAPGFLKSQPAPIKGANVQSEPPLRPRNSFPLSEKDAPNLFSYPLSPDPTNPSIHTTSPGGNIESPAAVGQTPPDSGTRPYLKSLRSVPSDSTLSQRAPHSHSGTDTTRSSEDMASTTAPMPSPSPRVTVSMWGRDQHHLNEAFISEDMISPADTRAVGISTDDNYVPASYQRTFASRAEEATWFPGAQPPRRGWAPDERSISDSVSSINELKSQREAAQRHQVVSRWMATAEDGVDLDSQEAPRASNDSLVAHDGITQQEIPLGGKTENKPLPGQIYYTERGGTLEKDDRKLMREHRVWADPPMLYHITKQDEERTQPETSAAAMARYDQMFHETSSILSRSATWGTRRRSLPSIADIDGVTSGNFLKKLSLSRERKPSILFKELRGLVRRPSASQLLKRSRGTGEEDGSCEAESQGRRESRDTLAPPRRTSSWTKKQQMPSLNTALMSMATSAAAFGTTHARTSSISTTTSPKSPFNLQVKNSFLRRPRSKSDLPRGASEPHSNLVEMWKKSGGPPVAQLARGTSLPDRDDDDDDDDDDDMNEEGDMRAMGSNTIDDTMPTLAGFKKQVLRANPRLAEHNTYLVDRIAHQQIIRYKLLLQNRVKHLQQVGSRSCPAGQMCIAMGGSAVQMDSKGETRTLDPLSTTYEASDEDATPLEGAITPESFPTDIPMPPTTSLPAEFECQLCYHTKKFFKPSDWTKHVHEDVQPFTCTWDRCREPKIFKRKADWVRHENEGHRHLEWWTCDVEDCKHTCYRRDNFLQHLVREHKFIEPKVKTKAALKRAGALDATWQKVEKCHVETAARPQDEPCRFCGKTLPSWKKLTVHLAKHMETMSLPILRLVDRKELDADTLISPVQDPPPRTFPPVKTETQAFNRSPNMGPSSELSGAMAFPNVQQPSYYHHQAGAFPSSFYDTSATMHGLQQSTVNLGIHQPVDLGAGFASQAQAQAVAAAAAGYHHHQSMPPSSPAGSFMASNQYMGQQVEPFPAFMNPLDLQDASGNSIYDNATAGLDQVSAGQAGDGHQQQHHRHQQPQQYSQVPPYARSPLHEHSSFFHPQRGRHG